MSTRYNNGSHYENHNERPSCTILPPTHIATLRKRMRSKITKPAGALPASPGALPAGLHA